MRLLLTIRRYRTDYNNNPPNTVSFMPVIDKPIPLSIAFPSSACANTTWHVPLPPLGVLYSAKSESR